MNKRGVTLIEMLIVVAVIGILAAIAIPGYVGQQRRAARTEASTNLQNLRMLEEQFFADRGIYAPAAVPLSRDYLGTAAADNGIEDILPGFRPGAETDLSYTYRITVPAANSTTFTATAIAKAGKRVSGDANCTINQNNVRTGPCW
ncbi:MAG: prepilin-type N-terminal cleavage/methylation domain-containing protein [Thermodesulfovibrionales bacterium]